MSISNNVRRLTEELAAHCSVKELAQLFQTEPKTIRNRLRIWGLRAQRQKTKPSLRYKPTDRDLRICSLYQDGLTLQKVGDQFGITRERVRQILVKNNIQERWTQQALRNEATQQNTDAVRRLYFQGYTVREAKKQLNISTIEIVNITPIQRRVHRAARFWRLVDKTGPIHPEHGQCWLWTGRKDCVKGYGSYRWETRDGESAHRVAYILSKGMPTQWVLHKCDNPPCVNPDHLYDGTPLENARDRDAHYQPPPRLTAQEIIEIREQYQGLKSIPELSVRYKRSGTTIYRIAKGIIYKQARNIYPDATIQQMWSFRGVQSASQVAQLLGVKQSYIYSVWNGYSGNHITGLPKRTRHSPSRSGDQTIR